jgi:hypothetical protein
MREVRKILLAGGQEFVDAAGDFIFCSFADRPFRIIIDGQPVTVRVGDKLRPEKRFRNFQIENLDPQNPIAVTLVVGEGDYNSQIIQGEVSIMPGIRGADGTWKDDTRYTIKADLAPLRVTAQSYAPGEQIGEKWDLKQIGQGFLGTLNNPTFHYAQDDGPGYLIGIHEGFRAGFMYLDSAGNVIAGSIKDGEQPDGWGETVTQAYPINAIGGSFGDCCGLGDVIYSITTTFTAVSSENHKLMAWDVSNGSVTEFYNFGSRWAYTLCPWKGAGILVLTTATKNTGFKTSGVKWHLITTDGELIREGDVPDGIKIGHSEKLRYSAADAAAVLAESGETTEIHINPEAGTVIETGSIHIYNKANHGWFPLGRILARGTSTLGGDSEGAARYFTREAWKPVKDPIAVAISSGSCNALGALARLSDSEYITSADINIRRTLGGALVKGEVIRAVLEFYFNRPVLDGYLDHVYEFATDAEPYGAINTGAFGGANSLQRLGIQDDFIVEIPGSFRITIDNELPLGNPGEF